MITQKVTQENLNGLLSNNTSDEAQSDFGHVSLSSVVFHTFEEFVHKKELFRLIPFGLQFEKIISWSINIFVKCHNNTIEHLKGKLYLIPL